MPNRDGLYFDLGHASRSTGFFGVPTNSFSSEPVADVKISASRLIERATNTAIVLKEEYEGLTLDMIFGDPEIVNEETLSLKCIFSRYKDEEYFGKRFEVPLDNLVEYSYAILKMDRTFIEEGDTVVGLKGSEDYSITSHRALYIGKAVTSVEYMAGTYSRVLYRDAHREKVISLETLYSTATNEREAFSVDASKFIPTFNPNKTIKLTTHSLSYAKVTRAQSGLLAGIMYPIENFEIRDNEVWLLLNGEYIQEASGLRIVSKEELA